MEKKEIFTIEDCDLGEVKVIYCPETNTIIADGLCIRAVPEEFSYQEILNAWTLYRKHYDDYGMVCLFYNQISQGERLFQ